MEDTTLDQVTIFLPKQFMNASECDKILLGYLSEKEPVICVTLCRKYDKVCETLINSKMIFPIGKLLCDKQAKLQKHTTNLEFLFTIETSIDSGCEIHDILQCELGVKNAVIILYDLDVVKKSFYFLDSKNYTKWCSFLIECNRKTLNVETQLHLNKDTRVLSWLKQASNFVYLALVRLPSFTFRCENSICATTSRIFTNLTSIFGQLRMKRVELCDVHRDSFKSRYIDCIRVRNTVWRNSLDVILGLCLMLYLMSGNNTGVISQLTMQWADSVVSELKTLLEWMMGVPAGLKLNSQLDQFLGNFFLYHIYLWTGYLSVLKPVLASLLWYISLSGILGLSIQIALLQDLISMMTIHIYCFYVYAARLYNLQVHALSSLWRLFRGKKWNALRHRVDSAHYDVDQLFVGTLLFTILLFLLPTTALYYAVFTTLRLLVLFVQGCLNGASSLINNCPVYFIVLSVFSPSSLADEPEFSILPTVRGDTSYTQYRSFKLKRRTWRKIMDDAKMCPTQNENETKSNAPFLQKLITGQLIYPWLDLN